MNLRKKYLKREKGMTNRVISLFVVFIMLISTILTVLPPLPVVAADFDDVNAALAALSIGTLEDRETNFTFPNEPSPANGVSFTWDTGNSPYIWKDGTVIRPPLGQPKASVNVTVTGRKGTEQAARVFEVTVAPLSLGRTIDSYEPINVDCPVGTAPKLPNYVKVTYENGESELRKVMWDGYRTANQFMQTQYPVGQRYTLGGSIMGELTSSKSYRVSANIVVVAGAAPTPSNVPKASVLSLSDVVIEKDSDGSDNRLTLNRDSQIQYLLGVDVSRMLYNYRATFGLSTEGYQTPAGWDVPATKLKGHGAGHYLSGLAFGYSSGANATQKAQLLERMKRMTDEMREMQAMTENQQKPGGGFWEAKDRYVWYKEDGSVDADLLETVRGITFDPTVGTVPRDPTQFGAGYINAIQPEHLIFCEAYAPYNNTSTQYGVWAPYYALHKQLAGLLDIYYVLKDGSAEEKAVADTAYTICKNMGMWIHNRLANRTQSGYSPTGVDPQAHSTPGYRDSMWGIYIAGEYGGVNETLARLSEVEKEKGNAADAAKLLEASTFFDNNGRSSDTEDRPYFADLAINRDSIRTLHANQHIPQIIGALYNFRASDGADQYNKYYHIAENFWDYVIGRYSYAPGAVGGNTSNVEKFVGPYNQLNGFNSGGSTCETCCVYNLLKLSKDLNAYNPDDAKYMDYYERAFSNQMIGSKVPGSDTNQTSYGYAINLNGARSRGTSTNDPGGSCCSGTGTENHVKYHEAAYFTSQDNQTFYVGLYIPTTATWKANGNAVIRQSCVFPSEQSTFQVKPGAGTGQFEMKFRVPSWAKKGFDITLNGVSIAAEYEPSTYVSTGIRTWSESDTVVVSMPYDVGIDYLPGKYNDEWFGALTYGPLVMATEGVTAHSRITLNSYLTSSKTATALGNGVDVRINERGTFTNGSIDGLYINNNGGISYSAPASGAIPGVTGAGTTGALIYRNPNYNPELPNSAANSQTLFKLQEPTNNVPNLNVVVTPGVRGGTSAERKFYPHYFVGTPAYTTYFYMPPGYDAVSIDRTPLFNKMTEARWVIDSGFYDAASIEELIPVLSASMTAYQDIDSTRAQLGSALGSLQAMMEDMAAAARVDIGFLEDRIDAANEFTANEALYTPESFSNLQDKLAAAETYAASGRSNYTSQKTADYIIALETAMFLLENLDKSALEEVLEEAGKRDNPTLADIGASPLFAEHEYFTYTRKSWQAFLEARQTAQDIYDDVPGVFSQSEIDAAVNALNAAMNALMGYQLCDERELLAEAIADAKTYKNDNGAYSAESFEALQEAIYSAEEDPMGITYASLTFAHRDGLIEGINQAISDLNCENKTLADITHSIMVPSSDAGDRTVNMKQFSEWPADMVGAKYAAGTFTNASNVLDAQPAINGEVLTFKKGSGTSGTATLIVNVTDGNYEGSTVTITFTPSGKADVNITGSPVTITYGVETDADGKIDLTTLDGELFTITPAAATPPLPRTYTIIGDAYRATGAGTIDATDKKTLTVTKAGRIAIGLETGETTANIKGERAVAILEVRKGSQATPAIPTLSGTVANDSLTLAATPGMEYTNDDDAETWQDEAAFTGLLPYTEYDFRQRLKETDVLKASSASRPLMVRTTKIPVTITPGEGTINYSGNPYSASNLNSMSELYQLSDGAGARSYNFPTSVPTDQTAEATWNSARTSLTVTKLGILYITISTAETDTHQAAGPVTVKLNIRAGIPAIPTAPTSTAANNTYNSITLALDNTYAMDYRMAVAGGTVIDPPVWQLNVAGTPGHNIFTGLSPNTAYVFERRRSATAVNDPSHVSGRLTVTTPRVPVTVTTGTATVPYSASAIDVATLPDFHSVTTPAGSPGQPGARTYTIAAGGTGEGTITEDGKLTVTKVGTFNIGLAIAQTNTHASVAAAETTEAVLTVEVASENTPAAPTVSGTPTTNSITLTSATGMEYRRDNGNWQDSATFSGLTPNTTYTFYQRRKGVEGLIEASAISPSAQIATAKTAVSGTVTIQGSPAVGTMLVAVTNNLPTNPGTLTYQWMRGGTAITGATSSTYTTVQADIGAAITVKVEASNHAGDLTGSPAVTVTKSPVVNYGGGTLAIYDNSGKINLSTATGLFVVGNGAGVPAYTISNAGNSTGTGTINGNDLVVTKAGIFAIELVTAETATHTAGAKVTATLMVSNNEKVVNAINKIASLGNVKDLTLANEAAVDEAKKLYDDLSAEEKTIVDNAAAFDWEEAKEKIKTDKADQAAADAVIKLIDSAARNVTKDSEAAIKAAEEAYNKLTSAQKAKVNAAGKKAVLTKARADFQKIPKVGETFTSKKLTYVITKTGVQVRSGSKSLTKVTIPDTVKYKNVTFKVESIASKAFLKNKKITTAMIGKNVKKVGAKAFKGCTRLKLVNFRAAGLKARNIGKGAFKNIHKKAEIKGPNAKATRIYKNFLKR